MNQYERLEALLLKKAYTELNTQELAFVAEHLSEADYQQQRELLQQAKVSLAEVLPPPAYLASRLRSAVRARKLNYMARAWRITAVAAVLTGVFLLGRWTVDPLVEYRESPVAASLEREIDTVYLERIVAQEVDRYVYRERVLRDTVYLLGSDLSVAPNLSPSPDLGQDANQIDPNGSRNAKTTSRILEMLVEVY